MRSFFKAFFSKPSAPFPALPRPTKPVCFIGDVHGRFDLLENLLTALAEDTELRIIMLGDMIDRGPDSALVLEVLFAQREHILCLMGNHERMMLDFLDTPEQHGPRWLSVGGAETLQSFGVNPFAGQGGLTVLADQLRISMPEGMEDWLRDLPLFWQEGRLGAVHAGADPDCMLEDQTEQSLLWGHRAFTRQQRRDGVWLAHGHTIVDTPQAVDGRIALDTGAWQTGRLSAARLDHVGLRFLDAS